jgi:hypothetical protein
VAAETGAELEDFEGGYQPARWMFSSGAEFPGAKGSFERATEAAHEGQFGGTLTFDFTGGGNYVGAILQMPENGADTAGEWSGLRLWLKRPEGNDFVFRYPEVIEAGGSGGQRLVGGECASKRPVSKTVGSARMAAKSCCPEGRRSSRPLDRRAGKSGSRAAWENCPAERGTISTGRFSGLLFSQAA